MKAGLEIHQQLATGKLFCDCPSDLVEAIEGEFSRRLHATGGETGTTDRAAQVQSSRELRYRYQVSPNSCLVEADEEPPHELNPQALEVALTMAELLGARVVDEVQVMRKIVVDGSNTSGFQRTALIAIDGRLRVGERTYSIPSICLEEDAARKVGEGPGEVHYRLDRLGIPLLEVATGPEIASGTEAREVAEALGALLRATRRVKRGLGTIREDLNVSIPEGARVEIKGVQELRWITQYVENEVERQKLLISVRDQLLQRGAKPPPLDFVDLSSLFRTSASRAVKEALSKGGVVLGLHLPHFAGLLGTSKTGPERLGRELADQARSVGLGGLFHSDELPAYGITAEEVEAVRKTMPGGCPPDRDAFVLVCGRTEMARRALGAVHARAEAALHGVPEETRDPVAEGRTRFSRPLPGRHRMYPETDVPPLAITSSRLTEVRAHLPERPEATLHRLRSEAGLGEEISRWLVREGEVEVFDLLLASGHPAPLVARLLTQELPPVEEARGKPIAEESRLRAQALEEFLLAVRAERFAKEALGPMLQRVFVEGLSFQEAERKTGAGGLSAQELAERAKAVVAANLALLQEKGMGAFQPLMGDLMAQVRGRRDGKEVAEVLRQAVEAQLKEPRRAPSGKAAPQAGAP